MWWLHAMHLEYTWCNGVIIHNIYLRMPEMSGQCTQPDWLKYLLFMEKARKKSITVCNCANVYIGDKNGKIWLNFNIVYGGWLVCLYLVHDEHAADAEECLSNRSPTLHGYCGLWTLYCALKTEQTAYQQANGGTPGNEPETWSITITIRLDFTLYSWLRLRSCCNRQALAQPNRFLLKIVKYSAIFYANLIIQLRRVRDIWRRDRCERFCC